MNKNVRKAILALFLQTFFVMADVHEPEVRSYNMSRIKGKDTKPEMVVRQFLHSKGYRYRLHGKYRSKTLPGKPDIVLPALKTAIFVHGCFWHAHQDCKYFKIPDTRTDWWSEKLYGNKARDEEHQRQLKASGWDVIVIWACELKKDLPGTMNNLLDQLQPDQLAD